MNDPIFSQLWWLEHVWIAFVGLGWWLFRQIWAAMNQLKTDLHVLEVELPKQYVRKSDLDSTLTDIRDHLVRIENKIDRKVDK